MNKKSDSNFDIFNLKKVSPSISVIYISLSRAAST